MGNKRLTIQRVDQFIRLLGATEKVNGYAEQQKQHAIACSNNYCRELEYQNRKSVKIKGETDGPKDLEHDSRASSGIRSTCQQDELRQLQENEEVTAELNLIEERIKELGFE